MVLGFLFLIINPIYGQKQDIIKGIVNGIDNPCLTDPCLPGVNFALTTDSINYFISINGFLQDLILVINNDTINIGDSLNVIGTVNIKQDINGKTYYVIEIESLIPLKIFNPQIIENIIIIYPNPTEGIFFIESQTNKKIESIYLTDIYGKVLLTSTDIDNGRVNIQKLHYKGLVLITIQLSDYQIIKKILIK